jgi:beta-mannosidase
MLGLSEKHWSGPLTEEVLAGIAARLRPNVVYVPNSPFGGAMPFSPDAAVTHYYGVGAYCRPLEDARRANIRFASECLAFAHVSEQATLDEYLPVAPVHDPRWKARVPRDRGASWDFEDIRDHYLGLQHDLDPTRLRREDPARYLDLSRAVSGEVSEATFGEWRHPGSTARGGLVWTLQDLLPGAGWGIIDATGRPKPVWHYLRRAFRPLQLVLTDEGTNGLYLHAINDGPADLDLVLDVVALKAGSQKVVSGETRLKLAARSARTFAATTLFGAFFDATYAFRFGPPAHDVTIARLTLAGATMAEAFHFPLGQAKAVHSATLTASLERDEAGWLARIATDRLAQSVHFSIDSHLPDDNWFHLAPGRQKLVRLMPFSGIDPDTRPSGEITSLSGSQVVRF